MNERNKTSALGHGHMSKEDGSVPGTCQANLVETGGQCPITECTNSRQIGVQAAEGVKRTLIFIVRDRPFEEARGNPLPTILYHLLYEGDAPGVGGRRAERGM